MVPPSDDVRRLELADLALVETELAENRVGVLAERGREPIEPGGRRRKLDRRAERPDAYPTIVRTLADRALRLDLRVGEDGGERVPPAGRDVVRLDGDGPPGAVAAPE